MQIFPSAQVSQRISYHHSNVPRSRADQLLDNVGCNTYSTALTIGEKAALLVAEDLGYSGDALKMTVPVLHLGTYEKTGMARL